MKRLLAALLALCLTVCMCGCAGEEEALSDVGDVGKAILTAGTFLPEVATVESDESLFINISDLDYSLVEGYFLAYSPTSLADEVVIVRVKNTRDAKKMEKSLEEHRQGRVTLFKNYGPTQVTKAENGLIFTSGRDVVLLISDNNAALKNAYEENRLKK